MPLGVARAVDRDQVKQALLQEVKDSNQRPTELLETLSTDYPPEALQTELADLLETGEIELTSNRVLRIPEKFIAG